MKHHSTNPKQKNSLFAQILRARKIKQEKERKMIDRMLIDRIRYIPQFNSYSKHCFDNSPIGSLRNYSDFQYRFSNDGNQLLISRRPQATRQSPQKQQQNYQELNEEEILNLKAKKFVNRLRKQRQYNEGKLLLIRKKQEQKRQMKIQRQIIQKKEWDFINKKQKINNVMDRILLHEERVSERTAKSLSKSRKFHLRSQTENNERENWSKSLNIKGEDVFLSLRRRVKQLSEVIDSQIQ